MRPRVRPGRLTLSTVLAFAGLGVACSGGDTTFPGADLTPPVNVLAEPNGRRRVDLSWNHDGVESRHYSIERRPSSGGEFTEIATATRFMREYSDLEVDAGTAYDYRVRACVPGRCSDASEPATATTIEELLRSHVDRPDDLVGAQVHVIYVIPKDGTDRALDEWGIASSVGSFDNWLAERAQRRIRFDRFNGDVDITFFRLAATNAQMIASGAWVVTGIEQELRDAGRLSPEKRYLIYYDGGSTYACGGAAWPPQLDGQAAAMYMQGTPDGGSCGSQPLADAPDAFPGYWEFAALHDLLHTLGIVSPQAPNHQASYPAHVGENTDLMYSGYSGWAIGPSMQVDVNGDDYFGAAVAAGLPTLASSPFIEAVPASVRALLRAPGVALRDRSWDALPPHPLMPTRR